MCFLNHDNFSCTEYTLLCSVIICYLYKQGQNVLHKIRYVNRFEPQTNCMYSFQTTKNMNFIPEWKYLDLRFTNILGQFTVVPGKTLNNKCKFLLHFRFFDFRFVRHARDESSVLISFRA